MIKTPAQLQTARRVISPAEREKSGQDKLQGWPGIGKARHAKSHRQASKD